MPHLITSLHILADIFDKLIPETYVPVLLKWKARRCAANCLRIDCIPLTPDGQPTRVDGKHALLCPAGHAEHDTTTLNSGRLLYAFP